VKALFSRKLVLGATGIALVGGGAAVAATQGSAGLSRPAYLADVARRLNVSPSALTAAIMAADVDRIEAAVAAGRLSQSQADALKQRIQQRGSAPFFAPQFGGGGLGLDADAAAQYLGVSRATLRGDRQSGKSLAQIASSMPGRSVEGLKAAIMAAEKVRLAGAVSRRSDHSPTGAETPERSLKPH
jgi:hypothetical protein